MAPPVRRNDWPQLWPTPAPSNPGNFGKIMRISHQIRGIASFLVYFTYIYIGLIFCGKSPSVNIPYRGYSLFSQEVPKFGFAKRGEIGEIYHVEPGKGPLEKTCGFG